MKQPTFRTCLRHLAAALFFFCAAGSAAAQAQQGISLVRDQEIEADLHVFARPIFEQAGLTPENVRFILVQDDDLNAFVAGGQNIFINTGLILKTENPAELFGVIAHEFGHIADGHLFRTQAAMDDLSVQTILADIIGIAIGVGAGSGEAGVAAASAGSGMAMRGILRHSRIQESSADQAGVRFLQGAGLPVTGFLSFMKQLGSQELLPELQQSEYVQTHPLTRDRIDFLQHVVDTQKRQGAVPEAWAEMHRRMKAKLLGYLYPARALAVKDDSISARYGRAIALHRQNRTQEALPLAAGLIAAEPKNPYFYELRGQMLFETGRIDDSLPDYAKAVALMPEAGLIRAAYGHALLESKGDPKNRLPEAVRQLETALQTEPRSPQTHRLLATAYGQLGDEGRSRLHLAEEALLQGKYEFAIREAGLAQKSLPRTAAGYQRAQDIIDTATQDQKDKKKK